MFALVLSLLLAQEPPACRDQAAPFIASALERGEQFDLAGASDMFFLASGQLCIEAEIAGHYLRGLVAARDAYRQGGSPESLVPVNLAIAAIDARAPLAPAQAATARAVLLAASAAAQSERDEMALLLEHAVRLEAIQIEAGQSPLPIATAHDVAGDLWLQVHRYEEAQAAYQLARMRIGASPRVMLGLARTAVRLKDPASACDHFRRLLAWWDTRSDGPAEIAEARTFVAQPACVAPVTPQA
jgi:tetratricopeptide (TPR) repeat protein